MSNDKDTEFLKNLLSNTIEDLDIPDASQDTFPIEINPVYSNPDDREPDINDDYSLVRQTLHKQLQLMDKAAQIALVAMMASSHPRSIEAFSKLMDSISSTSEKLLKNQKDVRDIKGSSGQKTYSPTEKSWTGTTTDLLDDLGDAQSPKYIIDNE